MTKNSEQKGVEFASKTEPENTPAPGDRSAIKIASISSAAMATAREMTMVTGLTDQRHRQLAKQGWFPDPIDAAWIFLPTVHGVIRFYREGATGSRRTLDGEKLGKLKADREMAELKVARMRGDLVGFPETKEFIALLARKWDLMLTHYLEVELGIRCAGKDAAEINEEGRKIHDEMREICDHDITEWQPPARPL